MKLLLVAFLSFSFSIIGACQIQFFEESANWKHEFSHLGGYGFVETKNTNVDTTIDDNSYLIFDRVYYLQNAFTQERDTTIESLYFREDENIIYQYDIDEGAENKFIDFNLNVGDTIDFIDLRYYSNDNAIITVSSKGIDTIQNIELNFQSIRIKASGQTFSVKFFEKIGPVFQNFLINEAVDLYGDAPLHRLCSYSSASDITFESSLDQCSNLTDFISANKGLFNEIKININPNPNDGSFYIETYSSKKLKYKLLDITCKTILKGETKDIKTLIELNNISPNLYFLTIEAENHFEVMKVFISH